MTSRNHNWDMLWPQAAKLAAKCETPTALARAMGISRSTLNDALKRYNDGEGIAFEEFRAQAATSPDIFHNVEALRVVRFLRKQPRSRAELSAFLDRSEATVDKILSDMIDAGYSITQHFERFVVPPTPVLETDIPNLFPTTDGVAPAEVKITFAVVSDTHFGSMAEQTTALNDFCRIAHDEYGVTRFLHGGDLMAGYNVYRGQMTDLYATTGVEQAQIAMHNLPYYSDAHWYIIGGNHDFSYYRAAGLDARREMLRNHPGAGLTARQDITLLPYDAATVPLLTGIDAHIWHPSGGIPYAYSYRGQRAADQLAFAELMEVTVGAKPKPTLRMLVIGHLHVMYSFFAGPIFVLGAGCFEGQTNYLKRKGLVPHIGGTIVQFHFVNNFLPRVTPTAIRYQEMEDDWRYWNVKRHSKGPEIIRHAPIFTWTGEPAPNGAMMQKGAT